MALKKKELDVHLRMKEVDLQIQEEQKRRELMAIKKQNVVQEGSFEGEAQGRAVQAFMDSLPASLTPEQKLAVWERLRDLEKSAMLYSKVSSIECHLPNTEVKKLAINVDAGAKAILKDQPMLLPSILFYSADGGVMNGCVGGRPSLPHATSTDDKVRQSTSSSAFELSCLPPDPGRPAAGNGVFVFACRLPCCRNQN